MSPARTGNARTAIFEAATAEFARHGLRGARVKAIVDRAGVNERMIYHYFGSKVGLYEAVLEQHWLGVSEAWSERLRDVADLTPRDATRAVFMSFAAILRARPMFSRLILQEAMTDWQHAPAASLGEQPEELWRILRKAKQHGIIRRDVDLKLLYRTVVGALTGDTVLGRPLAGARGSGRGSSEGSEKIIDLILCGVWSE